LFANETFAAQPSPLTCEVEYPRVPRNSRGKGERFMVRETKFVVALFVVAIVASAMQSSVYAQDSMKHENSVKTLETGI
jgi:hypothetical protein